MLTVIFRGRKVASRFFPKGSRYLVPLLVVLSTVSSAYAADLFFKGPRDLVIQAEEIAVGKRAPCQLAVHYYGKDPAEALIKIYLDGVNITSFPVMFEKSGTETGNFTFRVETQAKHFLEFEIVTPGEFKDGNPKNNRFSISFQVPGPVSVRQAQRPAPKKPFIQKQLTERERLKQKLAHVKKELEGQLVIQKEQIAKDHQEEISSIEEGNEDFGEADAVAYLDRQDIVLAETPVTPGKPVLDIFFPAQGAFSIPDGEAKSGRPFSWTLAVESQGSGEGEIEIVVADGNRQLMSQHVWIRGGDRLEIPVQVRLNQPGPHHLVAMINTLNNVVDPNLENNILEKGVSLS